MEKVREKQEGRLENWCDQSTFIHVWNFRRINYKSHIDTDCPKAVVLSSCEVCPWKGLMIFRSEFCPSGKTRYQGSGLFWNEVTAYAWPLLHTLSSFSVSQPRCYTARNLTLHTSTVLFRLSSHYKQASEISLSFVRPSSQILHDSKEWIRSSALFTSSENFIHEYYIYISFIQSFCPLIMSLIFPHSIKCPWPYICIYPTESI